MYEYEGGDGEGMVEGMGGCMYVMAFGGITTWLVRHGSGVKGFIVKTWDSSAAICEI